MKISLELKKHFVDNEQLEITQVLRTQTLLLMLLARNSVNRARRDGCYVSLLQAQLEQSLFRIMQRRGYGDEFIQRFRKMNEFNLQARVAPSCPHKRSIEADLTCVYFSLLPQRIPVIVLVSGGCAGAAHVLCGVDARARQQLSCWC